MSMSALILCTFMGTIGNILLDINAKYFFIIHIFYDKSGRNVDAQSRLNLIFANGRQRLLSTKNRIIKTPASVAYFDLTAINQLTFNQLN
ncbi:hypothetical protein ACTXKB_05665 [Psychrobacter aquimaris]|uniref:hypothetical protein n=1 Tax=Psychrobacter aquimaris TaxID=292733 RepID=UPI003FD08AA4